jgi:hypothetical protein
MKFIYLKTQKNNIQEHSAYGPVAVNNHTIPNPHISVIF